jgi:hypothetical protein
MKKLVQLRNTLGLFLLVVNLSNIQSQCNNSIQKPSYTVNISSANWTLIPGCMLSPLHYSVLNGIVAGNTYEFDHHDVENGFPFPGYITLRTTGGTLLAHGPSIFTWTATVSGTITAHWSRNVSCSSSPWCYGSWARNLTALPIELIKFNAAQKNNAIKLTWSTASETNNSHFDIERSDDGYVFDKIDAMQGEGHSSKTVDYSYIDDDPLQSRIVYYRLKQVDHDGRFSYSDVVQVHIREADHALRYLPDSYSILCNNVDGLTAFVTIYNTLGQLIKDHKVMPTQTEILVEDLPSRQLYTAVLRLENSITEVIRFYKY